MDPFATNTSSNYGRQLGQQSPSSQLTTNRLQLAPTTPGPSSFRSCSSTRIALFGLGFKWVNRFFETCARQFRNGVSHRGFGYRLELCRNWRKVFVNFPKFGIYQAPAPGSQPGSPAGVPKKAIEGAEKVESYTLFPVNSHKAPDQPTGR